ncbi:hypothetical protein F0L68_18090 [Solihabitans fulvus]|uniref:Translation initiation factor n=1 Tax=Solihabitans fulvus TaxID=1892852 RepID=A0A5B2XC01_9PSEU|nr:DUF6319 family protein [Solihabitans fulvus]KAA2261147.1 hypothetical protein F0L68_18090 [Solihabitans fulvus]
MAQQRSSKHNSLSPQDLDHLRAELAAGRPCTVWFTPAAVGVEAGRSAKVVAFDEPAEGDFIQLRPTGSKDVLSFSPAELTVAKPPRKPATKPAARAAKPEAAKPEVAEAAAPTVEPWMPEVAPTESRPARAAKPAEPTRPAEARPTEPRSAEPKSGEQDGARRPARAAAGRRPRVAEVTVTLTSTAEGEWTADVVSGKKRTVRAVPVPASAVAQAAKALHPEVAEAIETVLDAAREQHAARVAQLRAELEAAQRALDELTS